MVEDKVTRIEEDLAEGRQTEEVLQLTKFSVDHAAVSAYLIGKDARFLYANEQGCRALGYSREELLTMTVSQVDPDFPPARWPEHWAELKRQGSLHFETTHRRKDGRLLPVEVAINYLEYAGREYNWAFARDISERKGAEEERKRTAALTRTILDSMNDAISLIDVRNLRIMAVNRVFLEEYGYADQEEVAGKYCFEVTHGRTEICRPPDDVCPLVETLRTGDHHAVEHVHYGRQGEKIYVEVSTSPIKDEHGNIVQVVHVARNITERKLAEHALRESEEALRTVFNSTYDAILVHTPDGAIIDFNEKFLEMYGVGPEVIKQLRIPDLSDPAMPVDNLQEIWSGVLAGQTRLFDWRGRRYRDGATFPVEVFLRRVRLRGRDLILANVRDISERKLTEERLRRQEEELQKAQRLEAIGILAGGIAHDFNNILTAILGNINLARIGLPPESQSVTRLARAEQAALRATGLSRQLLTFAKGGAPARKAVSIPELVREAVELALRGSKSKSEMFFPPHLWPAAADESQLNQVVTNLVINGVQAMPEGGVIEVRAANEVLPPENKFGLAAGKFVRIAIQDHGVGIPAQELERIFDPYFTTKPGGTGLGLAISHSIVKRHGGAVSVDSVPGQGSTFTIHLPASAEASVGRGEEATTLIGVGRILVMDDEEAVSEVAAGMLEHLGYQVTTVRDGAEAVSAYSRALAAGAPYAAVITDLTVPGGMGGREAASRILALDQDAKIIVSSGYANDPILANYEEYGFQGLIPKPYKLTELGKVLQEVVGRQQKDTQPA